LGAAGEQRRGMVDPVDVRVVGDEESDGAALNIISGLSAPAPLATVAVIALVPAINDVIVTELDASAAAGELRISIAPPPPEGALTAVSGTRWLRGSGPPLYSGFLDGSALPLWSTVLQGVWVCGRCIVPVAQALWLRSSLAADTITLHRLACREAS
jgi:hypothetical protein